ncbi:uncharacterized protein LOC141629094 [Silene latifolia]|uniref:uncharacterized protein LOC141629094 n=1 Tax=Silene latifolia TaxID=37657 RepID=UPI003D76EF2E
MADNIKPSMPKTEKEREFMLKVKECSQSDLADKSITLGMDVSDTFLVQFIINSLPYEFGQFQVNYNTIKDKWNYQELKAMLIQEEGRLKKMKDQVVHFLSHDGASSSKAKPSKKGKNGKKGKSFFKGPESAIQKEKKCHFCKKPGHFKKDCPKRKAWFEKKGKHYSLVCFESNLIEVPSNTWWLDSGATTHISHIKQGYRMIQPIRGAEQSSDCLYVPDCARNLVSLSKLDNLGFNFKFGHGVFSMYRNEYFYGSGTLIDSLYRFNLDVKFSDSLFYVECEDDFSRYGFIYLLHEKAHSVDVLEIFINEVERQLEKKVKIVRSDRGAEFYGRFTENGQCPGPFAKLLESRETGNARFIENGQTSGSIEPRKVDIKEIQVEVSSPEVAREIVVPIVSSQSNDIMGQQRNEVQDPQNDNNNDDQVTIQEENNMSREQSRQPVRRRRVVNVPEEQLRRSIRERRSAIPDDYETYNVECDLSISEDPVSFRKAKESDNYEKWLIAMKEEMKSMDDNKVWDLVVLPEGSKAVGSKWVYKTKRDSKGNIERYKARLVAKGFTQKDGIDYKETFSPVSKKDSLRIVLALVAHYDLELHQMDVKTAFLNGELEKEVYMDQPEGFASPGNEDKVCRLRKSIYGLKQASRQWYLKFNDTITSYGFVEITVDRCIYIKISGSRFIILVLYVDDILLAANDLGMLHDVKKYLSKNFEMKDMGETSYVIGIEIFRDRSQGLLRLSQKAYIDKVLERYRMNECSAGIVPIQKGDKFSKMQCPRNELERKEMEKIPYASVVGSLNYVQTCTRPDISFAVGMLGRYQSNPGMDHWKAANKVLRYLQGTKELMLTYRRSDHLEVIGYSDSDYAGCVDSRKSTFGYLFLLEGQYHGKVGSSLSLLLLLWKPNLCGPRVYIFTSGGLEAVIELLSSCTEIRRIHLLEVLSALALLRDVRRALVSSGKLHLLIEASRFGRIVSKERAAQAIGLLGIARRARRTLVALGAIPALVDLLRDGDISTKLVAGNALGVISSHVDFIRPVAEAGVIPLYAELLRGLEISVGKFLRMYSCLGCC